jgi:hypothetical protein
VAGTIYLAISLSFLLSQYIESDTTLVMEHIFRRRIEDSATLEKLLKWYTERSRTIEYVRNEIQKEHRPRKRSVVGMTITRLSEIILRRPLEAPVLE